MNMVMSSYTITLFFWVFTRQWALYNSNFEETWKYKKKVELTRPSLISNMILVGSWTFMRKYGTTKLRNSLYLLHDMMFQICDSPAVHTPISLVGSLVDNFSTFLSKHAKFFMPIVSHKYSQWRGEVSWVRVVDVVPISWMHSLVPAIIQTLMTLFHVVIESVWKINRDIVPVLKQLKTSIVISDDPKTAVSMSFWSTKLFGMILKREEHLYLRNLNDHCTRITNAVTKTNRLKD